MIKRDGEQLGFKSGKIRLRDDEEMKGKLIMKESMCQNPDILDLNSSFSSIPIKLDRR